MLKINFYSLFFFTVLFLNSLNVLCSSFRQAEQSSFSSIQESFASVPSLFPIESSATPELHNWHFNSSSHTFIPIGWDPNNSTDIFNINNFSLPIEHVGVGFNHAFANRSSSPLLITDESTSSNITDIPAHTDNSSIPSVMPHIQQQKKTQSDEGKDHVLAEKKKKDEKRDKKIYTCPTCKKNLASPSSFKYHLKTHDPNRSKPYQCNFCDKSFTEKSILKTHIKRHKKEKSFKCDFCNKCFTTKQEKFSHHRIHTGEKPHKCTFCDKCFSTKYILQSHILSHTGNKPFTCGICQKGLSSKQSLKSHLNKHRGKKPYTCEKCQKSFREKHRLKEHRKLHKNAKPYVCGQCSKAYTTKDGLKYHIKAHDRPKPHTCHYCNASFAHKSAYENHIRYEESTDEDRKCHRCQKVFSDKYHLARHNKRVHPRINS